MTDDFCRVAPHGAVWRTKTLGDRRRTAYTEIVGKLGNR